MSPKPRVARQVKEQFDVYAFMAKWSRTLLQLAAGAFIISAGYILYGIFSGVLNQSGNNPDAVARYVTNLRLMGQVLAAASFLGALAFVLLTLSELAYAVLIGIIGIGLILGTPLLIAANLQQAPREISAVIAEWTHTAGMAILAVVGLRILYEIVEQLRTAGSRRKEREEQEEAEGGLKKTKKSLKPAVWSPCWGLPYCHEAVRDHCPAFKAHRSCWRFGYGCNCDPSLIERLIRSGALETAKGASRASSADKAKQAAYVRSDLQADAPVKQAERTIPCSKCPIFLDHQRQKFKIANPIAIIATLVAMVAAYIPLRMVYYKVVGAIATIASKLTFDVERVDPGQWVRYLETPALQVFFFIIVGLLLLAYVLKFVEWAIFEKKL